MIPNSQVIRQVIFGCLTDECNQRDNEYYNRTSEMIKAVEKALENMGKRSEKLKCHNDEDKSVDCPDGYCWMGREGNATFRNSYRGCFNDIPVPLKVVLGVIKFKDGVMSLLGLKEEKKKKLDDLHEQKEKDIAALKAKKKNAIDDAKRWGEGAYNELQKQLQKAIDGVENTYKETKGKLEKTLQDGIDAAEEALEKLKEAFTPTMEDLREVTGDHGIAVAALFMTDANVTVTGAYCSTDDCNKKGSDLEKSLEVIEDPGKASDSLLALYIPMFILAVLYL